MPGPNTQQIQAALCGGRVSTATLTSAVGQGRAGLAQPPWE